MNTLDSLENAKRNLVGNLETGRIMWKTAFIKERSARLLYENSIADLFPRSMIFRFITRHHSLLVWPVSYFVLKKVVLPLLSRKFF